MHIITCEAVVLAVRDLAESDKMVTCFTLEHGKVRGGARGAKKSRKRFGGALEPFAHLRLQLALKEGLSSITGADIVSIRAGIRSDLARIGSAGYACELTDRLTLDGERNQRLFRLLTAYLDHLDRFPCNPSDRRFYALNLLKVSGFQPPLEHCAGCGCDLTTVSRFRLGAAGGLLCERCGAHAPSISKPTVERLRQALQSGRFGQVRFSPEELEEVDELLNGALAPHLNMPLKSLAFLREVETDPA